MSTRACLVSVLLSILAGSTCSADWLVLRGGKQIETEGPWALKGNLLSIREPGGRPKTVLLSIIDYDATLHANPAVAKAKTKAPGWHVSTEMIKRLQEFTRNQEAMAAQMRARQEMSAEMHSVEARPGAIVAGAGGSGAQSGGKAQDTQYGGYATKGMQGVAACKTYQDSPSEYSSCLAQY
ncbi:MAG TPA: hypothetical protein VIH93_02680 [Thermoanaerobaculia bacterium]|jgi:hypothetical protein